MTYQPHRGPRRLGILGGGQLARMLAEAALPRGFEVTVLAPEERVPAAIDGVRLVKGRLDDETALARMLARCDRVTIENELLDLARVRAALGRFRSTRMLPAPAAIAVAQDKLAQKQLFTRLGIPTAPFEEVDLGDVDAALARLGQRFADGFVLKWSRGGYDGRGNLVVRDHADRDEARAFCGAGQRAGAAIYAEALIPFERELAMVATRSEDGSAWRSFPLVISVQEAGVCREVLGPATALGVPARLEAKVARMMRMLGSALGLCGTFALELFHTADGQLLANEMAPRVHNTGHYTLLPAGPSQFDLHVEAVMGVPLSAPRTDGLALMRNLLGPEGLARRCTRPQLAPPPGTTVHWYDKRDVSPGRKMGHLTGRAASVSALEAMRQAMQDYERRLWADTLQKGSAA